MQAALATGDPAALCPLAEPASAVSNEHGWVLAKGDVRRARRRAGRGAGAVHRSGPAATARVGDRHAARRKGGRRGRARAPSGDDRMGRGRPADRMALRPGDRDRGRDPGCAVPDGRPQVQAWRRPVADARRRPRAPSRPNWRRRGGVLQRGAGRSLSARSSSATMRRPREAAIARDLRTAYTDGRRQSHRGAAQAVAEGANARARAMRG